MTIPYLLSQTGVPAPVLLDDGTINFFASTAATMSIGHLGHLENTGASMWAGVDNGTQPADLGTRQGVLSLSRFFPAGDGAYLAFRTTAYSQSVPLPGMLIPTILGLWGLAVWQARRRHTRKETP